jgi:hypothetical protein
VGWGEGAVGVTGYFQWFVRLVESFLVKDFLAKNKTGEKKKKKENKQR